MALEGFRLFSKILECSRRLWNDSEVSRMFKDVKEFHFQN